MRVVYLKVLVVVMALVVVAAAFGIAALRYAGQ